MSTRLENLLHSATVEARVLGSRGISQDKTIAALQGEISKLKARPTNTSLERRVDQQAKRIGRMDRQIDALDTTNNSLTKQRDGARENIERLERQVGSLKTKLRVSGDANDRMSSNLAAARRERDVLRRDAEKADTKKFIAVGVLLGKVAYNEVTDTNEANSVTSREGQIVEY